MPSDGHYEIGQFDPSSGIYRHWEMPPALAATSDLALDGQGRVLFAAMAKDGAHYVIGRLDPATNVFTTWPLFPMTDLTWVISAGRLAPGGALIRTAKFRARPSCADLVRFTIASAPVTLSAVTPPNGSRARTAADTG